jgi:hypothetical protein
MILRKCQPESQREMRRILEKEPFGELERLVTQKLLDVAQGLANEELRSEEWLRLMGELSGRSYEQVRVAILEFLDTDVFHVSIESCVSFLDPMIDSWDIGLKTFSIEIILNPRLSPGSLKREPPLTVEPGFEQFLRDKSLSGDATEEQIELPEVPGAPGASKDAEVHGKATRSHLLLPRTTKPQFPTSEQPRGSD